MIYMYVWRHMDRNMINGLAEMKRPFGEGQNDVLDGGGEED